MRCTFTITTIQTIVKHYFKTRKNDVLWMRDSEGGHIIIIIIIIIKSASICIIFIEHIRFDFIEGNYDTVVIDQCTDTTTVYKFIRLFNYRQNNPGMSERAIFSSCSFISSRHFVRSLFTHS